MPRARSLEDALHDARLLAPAISAERVALADLPGRRLARPVNARAPIPAFTNSAMDGYAVRSADTPGRLDLTGHSAAGRPGHGALAPGCAWRISTGAPLPPGADAVVRQEDATVDGGHVTVDAHVTSGRDVRSCGEDVAAGAPLLPAGHVVAPHEVAVVAGAGHAAAWCVRRPRVAILVSGDELAEPGAPLADARVYDSNGHGVAAQAAAAGAAVHLRAVVPDDRRATLAAVRRILDGRESADGEAPDMLVTTGGVSVGPHDHLRAALTAAGVHAVVPRIRMQPGQPTWIGTRGSQVVLALAGNPVSAAVCFHVLGRALLGHDDRWIERLPLTAPVATRGGLAQLLRCRVGPAGLEPLPRQGSGAISSLAGAQALAWIPEDVAHADAGTRVRMLRLS